jgi:thioredoxin reductase (NADPH)
MFDVIIIGAGPAGCSAALYLCRGNAKVLLLTHGGSSLLKAHALENYYGFTSISGSALYEQGLAQVRRLGATVREEEVIDLSYDGNFSLQTNAGTYTGKALIMATGSVRSTVPLPGLKELEGKGVSYCAVCDGFFFRRKKVAVLGNGAFALHEAAVLEPLAATTTLVTDGKELPADTKLPGVDKKIAALEGTEHLTGIKFTDGSRLDLDGLFVALGTADTNALARKLGLVLEKNYLAVDKDMHTNIPGVFAAGDCIGGLNQVATAVGEGAIAGMEALKFIRALAQHI